MTSTVDKFESIPSLKYFDKYSVEDNNGFSTPVSKVETWTEFLSLLEVINVNNDWVFRGQEDGDWTLKSSLMRLCCNPKNDELNEMLELLRGSLSNMDLSSFIREDDIEQWCIARHYGLASPALDWSYDPRVGLFFAFENYHISKFSGKYSPVYMINTSVLKQHYQNSIYIHDDPNLDNRINAQKGVLIFTQHNTPFESKLENSTSSYRYFRKVYVPRNDIVNCLKILEQAPLPVSKKDIYPNSIEGAIQYCNFKLQRYFRQSYPAQTIVKCNYISPPTFESIDESDYHHFVVLDGGGLSENCVKCAHVFDIGTRSIEAHVNHYMAHGLKIIGLKENKYPNNIVKILISMAIEKSQQVIT